MTSDPILVVGIGASAGGIQALKTFANKLLPDCGIAYILVQHLSPDRPSRLSDVLARDARIPVHAATDGMQVMPDTLYVMPEGKVMEIAGARLVLHEDDRAHRERRPIGLCQILPPVHTGGTFFRITSR